MEFEIIVGYILGVMTIPIVFGLVVTFRTILNLFKGKNGA